MNKMFSKTFKSSRRDFIISSAAGSATLLFGASTANAVGRQVINLLNPSNPLVVPPNFRPTIWFTMEANGRTTVHILKTEMGQHVGTALAQVIAEELELAWEWVEIDYPEMTAQAQAAYGLQITGGSYSVHDSFDRFSRSAAAAREILIETGAKILDAEREDCIARRSTVVDTVSEEEITYSEILSSTAIEYKVSEEDLAEVKLKPKEKYKIIGTSVPAIDIPEKINGKARFGIDAYVPNMVYGKIVPAPTRVGSNINKIEDTAAKQIDGYITTLPLNFPAVVQNNVVSTALVIAENFPAAMRAAELVKVDWSASPSAKKSSSDFFSESKKLRGNRSEGIPFVIDGDISKAAKQSKQVVEASYTTEMVGHVSLEPQSALVQNIDGVWNVYAGCQAGNVIRLILSNFLKTTPDKIIFHPHYVGGGFGSRIAPMPIILAAVAAKGLNRPVKVIFTREDDMSLSSPRSYTYQHLTAMIGENGNVLGMKHDIVGGWLGSALGALPSADGKNKIEAFSVNGADHWYDVPNQEIMAFRNKSIENVTPVGVVRSISNNYTIFAIESLIDEVAHQLGKDPLAFRLSLLTGKGKNSGATPDAKAKHQLPLLFGIPGPAWKKWKFWPTYHASGNVAGAKRLANVLRISTGHAGYGTRILPKNTAHGIAATAAEERSMPTFCACVAEVSVNRNSGDVSVSKLTVAIDVGLAVNPDGIRAQVEGSLLWGLSNSLYEELSVKDGKFVQTNFDKYSWQTMDNLPELDIQIVENGLYPCGAGEPATSVVGAAIANGIYNAVGIRIRALPIRRDRILKALNA
ncbi:MAG: molybdopterin cofactor-binding domain-containing protein [Pseudomonadota bacterium]|nr:molybdopterin cofactor-binding domain-containing protein [Pseudomonadota bacterium]